MTSFISIREIHFCRTLSSPRVSLIVERVPFPRVSLFMLARAVGLKYDSAVTVNGNTSFFGNSAGVDGGEKTIFGNI